MKVAEFLYKCRLCGEIEGNICCSPDIAELILIDVIHGYNNYEPDVGTKPTKTDIHICSNFNRGVSDLIGYEIVDV